MDDWRKELTRAAFAGAIGWLALLAWLEAEDRVRGWRRPVPGRAAVRLVDPHRSSQGWSALKKEPTGLHKIGSTPFTDGGLRDVFEDAAGRQYVQDDDGELIAGQWLPPADDAVIVGP